MSGFDPTIDLLRLPKYIHRLVLSMEEWHSIWYTRIDVEKYINMGACIFGGGASYV